MKWFITFLFIVLASALYAPTTFYSNGTIVEFYNNPVQAQLLFKHPASANAVVSQIHLSALAPGQYVLQFVSDYETVSKQFIKQ